MNRIVKKSAMLTLGTAALVAGSAGIGEFGSSKEAGLVTPAHARVGRPLTPVSYAGVARRTTRRAVYTGAAVAASRPVVVAPAPTTTVVVAPAPAPCTVVVDTNGNVVQPCP